VKVGKAAQTISGVGVGVGVETMIGLTSGVNVAVNVGRLVAIGVSWTRAISGAGAIKDCQLKSVSISKKTIVPITTFKVTKYASNVTHCQVCNLNFFTRLISLTLKKR
jgi:hypothetical protein